MFMSVNPADGDGAAGDNRGDHAGVGDHGGSRDHADGRDNPRGGAEGGALSCSLPVS